MAGQGTGVGDDGGSGDNAPAGAPWLFGERALRTQLSDMYAAMVASTGNARLLLGRDPADVRREDAEGGDTARDQMAEACGWLAEARMMCDTPRAFDDVFLGCARSAAEYLVKVRGAGASTALFDSWVFRKSSPSDDGAPAAAGSRTVISAVVPCLGTCMSVRAPQGMAGRISHGLYRIGRATPMPLTNRLHCVSGADAVQLPGARPRLADWDFLKASPSDMGVLSDSIEMDGYCEIASVQDDMRQRLGAPVILTGTVEDLDDSMVVFRGLVGGEEVTAVRPAGSPPDPDGLPHGDGDVRRIVGAHGRFLVAVWYRPRLRGAGSSSGKSGAAGAGAGGSASAAYPELLHFEECGQAEAVLDDLVGYVRMRGRVGAGSLGARYGSDYMSIASRAACLSRDGGDGAVSYGRAGAGSGTDSPAREFLDAVGAMRAAWSRHRTGDGLPVAARSIASGRRADIASLASWVAHGSADRKNLLADLQDRFDRTGRWPGEPHVGVDDSGSVIVDDDDGDGDTGAQRRGIPRIAAGLERQGLLARDGLILSVTDKGRRVLAAASRRDAERYLSGRSLVYLPEVESRIPASILLRCLRDGRDFARAEGPGGRNALLWVRSGAAEGAAAAEADRCGRALEELHRLVLECARTANHPVNARFVHGELGRRGVRIAYAHVPAMLGQLGRAGRLVEEGSGGGGSDGGGDWRYPMRGRIIDTMRGDPARAWDVGGILGATRIAGRDARDVGLALEGLASDGLVAELENGRWGCRAEGVDEQGQRRRRAAVLARRAVLSMLRPKRAGMDSDLLVGMVAGHLSQKFSRNQVRGLKQIVRDEVSALAGSGRVVERDGMLRLAAP